MSALSILNQKVIPFNSFYQVKDGEIKEIPKIPLNPSPSRERKVKNPSTENHGTVSLLLEFRKYVRYMLAMPRIEEAKMKKLKEIPDLDQSLAEYRGKGGGARFSSIIWTRAAPPITNSAVALRFFERHEASAVASENRKLTVVVPLEIAKLVEKTSVLLEMCCRIFRFLPFPDVICILEPVSRFFCFLLSQWLSGFDS